MIKKSDIINGLLSEMADNIEVLRRNSRRTPFDGSKIAIAIKKGFDSVLETSFTDGDSKEDGIDSVYISVLTKIKKEYVDKKIDKINVEEIQDIIEGVLKEQKFGEIYESFSEYRLRRAASRDVFSKEFSRMVKTLEGLGLKSSLEDDAKRENANVDGDTAMGTMLQYGSTVSKSFAKSYLIKDKFSKAHDDGDIHIHDLDFYAMGTTTCLQIDLGKLFKGGFSTGHGFLREPQDIMSYTALAAIAVQANQNDQHGGQSIPALDFYLAPGVLKTFKKFMKQYVYDMAEYSGFLDFIEFDDVVHSINLMETMKTNVCYFKDIYGDSAKVRNIFSIAIEKATAQTDRRTHQAMEGFIHNLNTMHSRAGAQVPFSSVNFGTDTSIEGRMVIKNYLLSLEKGLGKGETPIFPISIFKLKEGVTYNPEDPNYDLFELACKVSAKRLFPNFSFLDSKFNKDYYKEGNYDTEVSYMGCRTRVIGNVVDKKKEIVGGRGNVSFSSINLPRLAIKHGLLKGKKSDFKAFYEELDEKLNLIKNQLLDRFEYQGKRRVYNSPFLMGEGLWLDSEKLNSGDRVKKVLRNGTLSIGFIGLAESLVALTGKHHGEDKKSQELGLEIIKFMRDKCDEFALQHRLNFTLIATPAEGLSGRFVNMDRSIYGEIKGVTDRSYYTNSFHVPVYYETTIKNKIELEAPYHAFSNAGHISYIEIDGAAASNVSAFMDVIRIMKEAGMGYGAVNHPLDRDPVCGFSGVIGDICPGCNRKEEGVGFDRIRRITGYLVGTVDRFNNAKRSEEKDRVKHEM